MTNVKQEQLLYIVYKTCHVLFSLDFGFIKFKSFKIKVFVRTCSLVQSLFFSIYFSEILDQEWHLKTFLFYHLYVLHYIAFVIVLTFFKHDSNLCDLLSDLRIIDEGLNDDRASYRVEIKMLLVIFLSITLKLVDVGIYCFCVNFICLEHISELFCYLALSSCNEFVQITCSFVFYSILCRLKKLVAILESTNFDYLSIQLLYKSIVDLVEKYKDAFELLYITALLFNMVEAMGTIYYSVSAIWDKTITVIPLDLCSDLTAVLSSLLVTFAPALCAGMLTSQADRIKVILHDKLLEQRDEAVVSDLERFIRYVEARPCRFRVGKVIPLNADLLGLVLSFCAKYLIVIIQFADTNYKA